MARIGVIGIGFGQQVHVPAFRADPRVEVVAICARRQDRAEAVARRLGIPEAYGDWRTMLAKPGLDAVTLAVPPVLQTEMAVAALQAGKAVFCEKPMAASLEGAIAMTRAARETGLANLVDYEFPEIPEWAAAATILSRGQLGKLRHVGISWNVETYAVRQGLESWKTSRAWGGGVLYGFASHVFYYLEALAGRINKLCARLHEAGENSAPGRDSLAFLWLELEAGTPVSVVVSSQSFLGSGHRVEFYGEQGSLILENPTPDYAKGFKLWHGDRHSGSINQVDCTGADDFWAGDGRVAVVARLAAKFVDWLATGKPCRPAFGEGLRVQQLLDAALRSHLSGAWVEVGEEIL